MSLGQRLPGRSPRGRSLRDRALGWLARREWGRAELRARLISSGGEGVAVDTLLDELQQAGYLSDERFAGSLVRQRAGTHARRAIAGVLRERGVESATAREALAALDGIDEFEQARSLWQGRFGVPPQGEREKARQLRFLLARGYSHAIAFKVLRAAGAPNDADEPA